MGVTEEGRKFYHDRVYTMKGIPKQYLGLTNITASADTIGDLDVQWTFKIDQSAYVYIGFDERWDPPEDRKQNPKKWFSNGFTKTGGSVVLRSPSPTDYWIYKSNEPYPKGKGNARWNEYRKAEVMERTESFLRSRQTSSSIAPGETCS